jgi:23S rRNA (uracil747-C5)-methyltransferase
MHCAHFQASRCQSCQWLAKPYTEQLQLKQQQLLGLLAPFAPQTILPPVASEQQAFRYKAKMVVQGSYNAPLLGIVNQQGQAVDLADCPLYPSAFAPIFAVIKQLISRAKLEPYDISSRRGELKYVLLQQSYHSGHFMLRLVLRSKNCLAAIQKHLTWLQQQAPALAVVSVNLQPKPAAILEGPEEILLTEQALLREQLNQVPLYLSPQSFFQINPALAAQLYATAANWLQQLQQSGVIINRLWDLFCGVGGFGLHLASPKMQLTGIEIAPAAIASARQAALELGLTEVDFRALDSAAFASAAQMPPDLLVVNPPRRGLGAALVESINRLSPAYLIYSSCNAETLATDLSLLANYQLQQVQLFDLFAHSSHYEVLTLLKRHD